MKKLFFAFLLLSAFASAQTVLVRWTEPFPSISSQSPPFLVANANAVPTLCKSPSTSPQCVFQPTYQANGTPCPNGAQDVPDPNALTAACQTTTDSLGNVGFWVPPGTYDLFVTIGTTILGPYTITPGGSGGGGSSSLTTESLAILNQTTVSMPTTFQSLPIYGWCVDVNNVEVTGNSPYPGPSAPYVENFGFATPQSGTCYALGNTTIGPPPPPPGVFSCTPSSLPFGLVAIGSTSTPQIVTCTNNSTGTVTSILAAIVSSTNSADFAIAAPPCTSLTAGTSCTFQANFTPSLSTLESATITITSSQPNQTVLMSGTGFPNALTGIAPTTLTFPSTNSGQSSQPLSITINLVSGSSVTFTGITMSSTGVSVGTNFSVTSNCANLTTLAPSCTAQVTFSPTTTGALNDTVVISSNASNSPQSVQVSGVGQTAGAFSLSSIAISPLNPTIGGGGTQQENLTLTYSDGSTRPGTIGGSTTIAGWNTGTAGVASVTQGGLITGVATGTSVISANSGGVSFGLSGQSSAFAQAGSSGSGGTTPAFRQANSGSNFTGASLTVAFSSNTVAGNAILACVFDGGASAYTTPTDTQLNTYSPAAAAANNSKCFTTTNIVGGADTVTFARTGGSGADAGVMEFSGVSNTAPVDGTIGQSTGTGTTWTSSTTTSNSNDLLVEWFFTTAAGTIHGGNSYSVFKGYGFGNGQGAFEGLTLSASGAQTCPASSTTSIAWTMKCIALTGGSGSSSSTVSLSTNAFPGVQGLGNTNVIPISWQDATATIASVVDAAGNTYTHGTGCLKQAGGLSSDIYYSQGIMAKAGNKVTVTWNGTGAAGVVNVGAIEFQGLTGVDGSCTVGSGTSASPSVSVTPAHSNNTLVGVYSSAGVLTSTVGASATQLYLSPGGASSTQFQDVYSTSAVSISNTNTGSAAYTVSVLPFVGLIASTTAAVSGSTGTYSISKPPPIGWYPFSISDGTYSAIFSQPIKNNPTCLGASSPGITAGNCAAGDLIAKANLTGRGNCYNGGVVNNMNCGFLDYGNVGNSTDQNPGWYYCDSSCPWFQVSVTAGSCSTYTPGQNFSFHAPSGAVFSGSQGDQGMTILDQGQTPNLLINLGSSNHGTSFTIGTSTCPGTGPNSCAKLIPSIGVCGAARVNVDKDWSTGALQNVTVSGNAYIIGGAITSAIGAEGLETPILRMPEFFGGSIPHALSITVPCTHPTNPVVFPDPGPTTLAPCPTAATDEASAGMLMQLDYTATELGDIASKIPPWQFAIISDLTIYGGYVKATFGGSLSAAGNGMNVPGTGGLEGPTACSFYFGSSSTNNYCVTGFNTLVAQGGILGACGTSGFGSNNCYQTGTTAGTIRFEAFVFQGIPLEIGPEGTDSSGRSCTTGAGCDITGHMHTLDQCNAKTFAGLPGGC